MGAHEAKIQMKISTCVNNSVVAWGLRILYLANYCSFVQTANAFSIPDKQTTRSTEKVAHCQKEEGCR